MKTKPGSDLDAARDSVSRGVVALAEVVKVALGPRGRIVFNPWGPSCCVPSKTVAMKWQVMT